MRTIAAVGLLLVSTLWAQEPAANPQPPSSPVQTEPPITSQDQTITIPAGTRIPLALAGPVSSKSRPGDHVRATTGFPVTVGSRLAIPVGTYVEGLIDKVARGGRSGPSLQTHFTRLVYANGYTVEIDGANVQAKLPSPKPGSSPTTASSAPSGVSSSSAFQAIPQTPTLQPPGPHIGTAIGIAIGSVAAGTITVILLAHHGGGSRDVLFDTGWQFEMVLESPVNVDAARVAAASAGSSAQ